MINTKVKTEYRTENTTVVDDFQLTNDDISNKSTKPTESQSGGGGSSETPEEKVAREAAEQAARDKAVIDLETAKKFGGTKLDDKGNAVDDTGKIIKSAEDIKKELDGTNNQQTSPEAVEIEGVQYKLDKDGNALDKDGKVFKTKAQLDQMQEDVPLIQEILQKSGYTPKGADGKPKVYEDSPEGIIEFANDVAFLKYQQEAEKEAKAFPDVEDYKNFRKRGGDPADYFEKQSKAWTNVKFDENDETLLTNAVVAQLMNSGMGRKEAEETAKLYKDTNKLKDFGKSSYNTLVKGEKEAKAVADKAFQEQQEAESKELEAFWTQRNEIVKKGKLHSVSIPDAEKDDFFKFISLAVDENGNSAAAYERAKLTPEQSLELDYILYKKLDLSKLIKAGVTTQTVKKLRDRIARPQKGAGNGEGTGHGEVNRNPNSMDITLDKIS